MDGFLRALPKSLRPTILKSNELIIEEALIEIKEFDLRLEIMAQIVEEEEADLKKDIMNELDNTQRQMATSGSSINDDIVMQKAKTLYAKRKTREIYTAARTVLQEREAMIAQFYTHTVVGDIQGKIDEAMSDIASAITVKNTIAQADKGKKARGTMKDVMLVVSKATTPTEMTPEEKRAYDSECISVLEKIAGEMGKKEVLTGLNRKRNSGGQFTSAEDVETILPSITA